MIDDFCNALELQAKLFKKYIIERLESFNDSFPVHADSVPQGFPFLNLISRDYYLQKVLEPVLEAFVRYYLFNGVFLATLPERYNFSFYEKSYDGRRPNPWSNKECDERINFDFVETQGNIRRGFRYSEPPLLKSRAESFLEIVKQRQINEIVIIDMTSPDAIGCKESFISPIYEGLRISRISIKTFFLKYYNEEYYKLFIEWLSNTIDEYKDYIGIVSIPKLTPHYLFSFRFRVEKELEKHIAHMENFKNHREKKLPDGVTVGYHFIDPKNEDSKYFKDLETRSQNLLYSSGILKKYKTKKLYRALVGRSSFAKCFETSEYLYSNFSKSDQFDYAAIVSGYLKSVEQLLYKIVKQFKPPKEVTMMAPLARYVRDHKEIISLSDDRFKDTLINCLYCYKEECRNDTFHLHNLDMWDCVTQIRNNTFFIHMLLLCCFDIEDDVDDVLESADDRLSRIYYQMTTHDETEYGIQFDGGHPILVDRPFTDQYEEYDNNGLMKKKKLILYGYPYDVMETPSPEKITITITNNHFPRKLWIEGDNGMRNYLEIM